MDKVKCHSHPMIHRTQLSPFEEWSSAPDREDIGIHGPPITVATLH